MALSGTLEDMGINDVLQLPTMGARSGKLTVKSNGTSAELFYHDGSLVHAVLGERRDIDVVVVLLGWTEGEFEFQVGTGAPAETITDDLHVVLMHAAKRHDEQSKSQVPVAGGKLAVDTSEVSNALKRTLHKADGILLLCFVDSQGQQLAVTPAGSTSAAHARSFGQECFRTAELPARSAVKRIWIEDGDGHSLWLRLGENLGLVLMAKPTMSMGQLMLAASKLASSIRSLVTP